MPGLINIDAEQKAKLVSAAVETLSAMATAPGALTTPTAHTQAGRLTFSHNDAKVIEK